MIHARVLVVVVGVLASACGPLDEGPLSTAVQPPRENDATAPADPECAFDDAGCCHACLHVNECRPEVSVPQCEERCLASRWVGEGQEIHCLALRVFWINEEHCARVGPTWDNFDDDDDCTGVGPDEPGYGPF